MWQKPSASWATAKCRIIFEECRGVGFEALMGAQFSLLCFDEQNMYRFAFNTQSNMPGKLCIQLQNAIQIRRGFQVAAPIKGLGAYFMQVQSVLKLRVRIVNCSPDFPKNAAYSNNGFKRKTGLKQRPFSGHETGAKNVKADNRPSHFWLRFCVRQAAAFL